MSQQKSNSLINSSKTTPLSTLARQINTVTVARFLGELANLDAETWKSAYRFVRTYKDLLPSLNAAVFVGTDEGGVGARSVGSSLALSAVFMDAVLKISSPGSPDILFRIGPITALRELVRNAWKKPTALDRELSLLRLLQEIMGLHAMKETPAETYKDDRLMLFMLRAVHLAEKMRYCGNPECPAPYFLAVRRSQKYCSEACALPAQREFKRAWWADHGEDWRKGQKARPKKTQRKRGK